MARGFASSADFTDDSIRQVIKRHPPMQLLDRKQNKGKRSLPARPIRAEHDYSTAKPRLTQKQLIEFVKQIDQYIAGKYGFGQPLCKFELP